MEELNLEDFLNEGIIREKDFRKKIENYNWRKFSNNKVLIKGCASVPIPTWAYLIITCKLSENNADIFFGEKCSAYKIN